MAYTPQIAPFTKYTDFVGEIRIPGLIPSVDRIGDNGQGDAAIADLGVFIAKYEKQLFVKLLSQTTYDAFCEALAGDSDPDTKWVTLLSKLLDSKIAANYTYYWFMRDGETSTGIIGEVIPNAENAKSVSANVKMCRAWNEMSNSISDLLTWLQTNEADYDCVLNGLVVSDVVMQFRPINILNI